MKAAMVRFFCPESHFPAEPCTLYRTFLLELLNWGLQVRESKACPCNAEGNLPCQCASRFSEYNNQSIIIICKWQSLTCPLPPEKTLYECYYSDLKILIIKIAFRSQFQAQSDSYTPYVMNFRHKNSWSSTLIVCWPFQGPLEAMQWGSKI